MNSLAGSMTLAVTAAPIRPAASPKPQTCPPPSGTMWIASFVTAISHNHYHFSRCFVHVLRFWKNEDVSESC